MGKIPYLIRRNNVFYFRIRVPAEHQNVFESREIIQSLRTENREEATRYALKLAANFKALLHELKSGRADKVSKADLLATSADVEPLTAIAAIPLQTPAPTQTAPQAPLLSVVVTEFLKRYDPAAKAMLGKLNATLPILVELVGDKPVNQILQADLNRYFDEVQRLPVRRDAAIFKDMAVKQIIAANTGACIAQKTFEGTYRACVGVFLTWATVNFGDQGFPSLSTKGCEYRGDRADGINKQRAATPEELQKLFGNPKMKKYAANPETEHYFWLPTLGLYSGARINELCQLNPAEDIKQDSTTGIYYLSITDESETAKGVDKSIKTSSSRRIVPIHSQLIDAGFLDYVDRIKETGHKILFPAWQPRNGKASANAGKWFVRYLESIGLRSEEKGARLSGFHMFRHGFVTHGMNNKISQTFQLTGHETGEVDGMKLSAVAKGYWTRGVADNIVELKEAVERFDFGVIFCQKL